VRVGGSREFEAVVGVLLLDASDHLVDGVLAIASHERVEVAGLVRERLGEERTPALRVLLVPRRDVAVDESSHVGHRHTSCLGVVMS
jgi:hypothetical protein